MNFIAALRKVTESIKAWVETKLAIKQDKLTGVSGQVISFDADGNAIAQNTFITTEGDGTAYTATVDGITSLTAGTQITIVPHVVSASTTPTLNLNNLGAKQIRRRLSSIATAPTSGYSNTWLAANKPFTVKYDGTYWITEDNTKPVAADLYGTLSVEKGGTGATTAEAARTNLGIVDIPSVTTSDNGKFLRVVDGAWAAVAIDNAEGVRF